MFRKLSILVLLVLALPVISFAQNSNYRTLLPESVMDEIIGEISGETALHHIIEMGAYNHNRPASEYSGSFFETDYVTKILSNDNIDGVKVYRYPGGTTWDGISGELWEVKPGHQKIADYDDLTAMLAQGSKSCDITAPLVWVGDGSAEALENIDVKGKIAFSSGSPRLVHNNAVKKGALGIVTYYSPRPLKVNLAIPITGISGRESGSETFGFLLPPREGEILRDRLLSGENIVVNAKVEAQNLEYDLEIPSCIIEGSDPDAGEVILSAHLFEGYVKQGANDNLSGSASLMEVARALKTLIDEGRIEKPARTIRFIWVPEYSGTAPWVNNNRDITSRTLCNINLDMVGINLAENGSFLTLQRTTYGNAHFINDVMQNYFEFVGITNREGLAVSGRGGFTKRIVAPSGTDQPFYFQVDDHYGSSDHEVFNDPAIGVPGVMMITWPDLYYHTSQDRADKCDPTELKRACVIAAAGAYTIASADSYMAMKIAGEITANSSARIGAQLSRATDLLSNSGTEDFESRYKLGREYIQAATINEKATLSSLTDLDPGLQKYINSVSAMIDETGVNAMESFDMFMKATSLKLNTAPVHIKEVSQLEEARKMIPYKTDKVLKSDYGFSRQVSQGMREYTDKLPVNGRPDVSELIRLSNGKNSVADIKMLLDTQMMSGENDLESIKNLVTILNKMGYLGLK